MAGKSKGRGKDKGRSKKGGSSRKFSTTQRPKNKNEASPAPRELDLTDFSEEITKQIETAFSIKDDSRVELSLPPVLETETIDNVNPNDPNAVGLQDSPKVNSLRKRLRSFTGSSAKSVPEPDRQSWNHQSPSKRSLTSHTEIGRSLRSNSTATQSTGNSTISVSSTLKNFVSPRKNKKKDKKRPAPKRSVTAPPKFLKCIMSPHDYMFLDLDFGKPTPREGEPEGEYHRVALHAKSRPELIDYVRSVAGTEIKTYNLKKSEAHRVDEVRKWETVNLRCIDCRGDCPICGAACCVYENARRTEAKAGPDADGMAIEMAAKAHQIMKIIDSLGPRAKDATTFSMCSQPGGCGRYVCPGCCGVCPSEICHDIQCKECKPDPWGTCDWHD
ncbi:hypothetical protein FE257_001254 [Aspergillus nanangensis]|uniref:Uncharacterized protein n=1 Tax=Aspergillus nanangensis TaxID=2582783 RepID=A0AAD4CE13_ASPNN|nr:hypothetical protein FE257_001254 [Aspergillus nanangensis]